MPAHAISNYNHHHPPPLPPKMKVQVINFSCFCYIKWTSKNYDKNCHNSYNRLTILLNMFRWMAFKAVAWFICAALPFLALSDHNLAWLHYDRLVFRTNYAKQIGIICFSWQCLCLSSQGLPHHVYVLEY